MELLFTIPMYAVLPFWLLMIFLPTWRWTQRIVQSPWIAVVPAVAYAALTLPNVTDVLPAFSPPTIDSLTALLATPTGATIAWLHFLAFDLLVGRWIYLDSREQGFNPIYVSVILVPAFLLAPIGFVAYLLLRVLYAAARNDATVAVNEPRTAEVEGSA